MWKRWEEERRKVIPGNRQSKGSGCLVRPLRMDSPLVGIRPPHREDVALMKLHVTF